MIEKDPAAPKSAARSTAQKLGKNDLHKIAEQYGELMAILVEGGSLAPKEVAHAGRIQAKLGTDRPLLDIVLELGYISEAKVWETIRKKKVPMRIGTLLVELGILSKNDLETAFTIQKQEGAGKKLGEILVSHHFIKEQKLMEVLSLQMGYAYVDPRFTKNDIQLMKKVPPKLRERASFLPVRVEEGMTLVVFVDPLDRDDLEEAESLFPDGVTQAIGPRDALREVYRRFEKGTQEDIKVDEETAIGIVDSLIMDAMEAGASDIHIEPQEENVRVRFRRDGVLELHKEYPLELAPSMASRLKILSGADITEKRRHQGGRLLFDYPGGQLDLRASFFVTIYGEAIVLRLLNKQGTLLDINALGMFPKMQKRFLQDGLNKPSGVTIVTGPTGSGKTTTVYSCINHINNPNVSIITAEEPVEYVIPGISQCSIDPKINLTFDETLRHIVRQDPDIIVIGEIRDSYSADVAVQAALTGHKVLSTFHTEDSIGGLLRLLNMDIEAFLISSTVVSVVAQRLLRRVCKECGRESKPSQAELQLLGYTARDVSGAKFRRGRGCPACRYTGYAGRVAVFELLILDEFVRSAILDKRTSYEIRNISLETSGLVTLFEEGIVKAANGITTIDEVLRCLPQVQRPRPLPELRHLLGG